MCHGHDSHLYFDLQACVRTLLDVMESPEYSGSNTDSNNSVEGSTPPSLVPKTTDVGKRVVTFPGKPQKERHGVLRYIGIGDAQFAEGVWCGVELNAPRGKNGGSVGGIRYFQ